MQLTRNLRSTASTEVVKAPPCFPVQPLDGCKIQFDVGETVDFNTTVGITVEVEVKAPMVKGDTIELAMPGFTAPDINKTVAKDLPFTKTITLPPASSDSASSSGPNYELYPPASAAATGNSSNSSSSSGAAATKSTGCFKATNNGTL